MQFADCAAGAVILFPFLIDQNITREILFSLPNKHNLTDHCAICNKETLVK